MLRPRFLHRKTKINHLKYLKMNHNFFPAKGHIMKHPVFIIIVSVVLLIITTLALPWYTQVVSVNDYYYSVSKAGARATASLPVTLALVVLLLIIAINPARALSGARLKIIFLTGLWITLYSSVYYCVVTAVQYTTPGFGTLVAVAGGAVLMMVCIASYTQK